MNDFLEILSREVDNPDCIYLYSENDCWYAYEQSACRLKQIASGCSIEQVVNLTYEVVLIRARISDWYLKSELDDFLAFSPGVLVYDTHLEIPLKWQSRVLFDQWKQVELAVHTTPIMFEKA